MYTVKRYYRNKKDETDITTKEYESFEKALAYGEKYANGKFIKFEILDNDNRIIYIHTAEGEVIDYRNRIDDILDGNIEVTENFNIEIKEDTAEDTEDTLLTIEENDKETELMTTDENINGDVLQEEDIYISKETDMLNIPAGTEVIEDNAFSNQDNLKIVVIPDGVKSIGNSAFENCVNLQEVHLPDSIEVIGNNAFKNCKELFKINIPENVKDIGDSAFEGCKTLEEIIIPSKVIVIPKCLFKDCINLFKVILSNGVLSIMNYAFDNCTNLNDVKIADTVLLIYDYAFANCGSLKELHLPRKTIVDKYSFSENTVLIRDTR